MYIIKHGVSLILYYFIFTTTFDIVKKKKYNIKNRFVPL